MIHMSHTNQQFNWLSQNNKSWAIAFAQFSGRIGNQFLAHGLLQSTLIHPFISKIVKSSPINICYVSFYQ